MRIYNYLKIILSYKIYKERDDVPMKTVYALKRCSEDKLLKNNAVRFWDKNKTHTKKPINTYFFTSVLK